MKAESAYYSLPENKGYDALEVHTVVDVFNDVAECLSDGDDIPDSLSFYWSLYGHTPNEGLECIGDFNSFEAACKVAEKLGGEKTS